MKLSIIIPTFNSAAVLGRALDSVVSQTFADWEVLVMDGASKDDTVSIAQSYQDSRIEVFSEPDLGIYDAMNKGIDKSKGQWLYFLGSDDWLYDNYVLERIFHNDINEYDVVYGSIDAPQLPGYMTGEWSLQYYGFNRCHQAIFYKRSFFGRKVRYDISYKVRADYVINLQWFFSSRYKKKYIPIVVAHFSAGGYSSNTDDDAYYHNGSLIILRYGHKILPIVEKKSMAYWYISANSQHKFICFLLNVYIVCLRIKAKLGFTR